MRADQRDARQSPSHRRAERHVGGLGALWAAIRAMRPNQWSKNVFVLVALVFARKVPDSTALIRTLVAFAAFCLAASAIYIVNDIADRERDRIHPRKRLRPIASGDLSIGGAAITLALCLVVAVALVVVLTVSTPATSADPFLHWGGSRLLFVLTIASYVGLNLAYSFWLKHQVLWDVFIIAAGFVLRALAGAFVIPVPISTWFYVCATFLALFLALGKRRSELIRLDEQAANHRQNLRQYTLALLDQLISIVVAAMLLTYCLYTFQGENSSHALMLTIPVVLFGTFRYLYLMYVYAEGDRPDEVLWKDRQILGTALVYTLLVVTLLYLVPAR